ncbi:MAG: DUF5719 family protein, partial [Humibacter sp.]
VPVVVSARTAVIGSKTRDFTWFSSAQPLLEEGLITLPGGSTPTLHVANPGDADRTVSLVSLASGSKPSKIAVPAEGGAGMKLNPGTYKISGAEGLTASVSFASDGRASSFALTPPGPLAAPITVYPN